MDPVEVAGRIRDALVRKLWRYRLGEVGRPRQQVEANAEYFVENILPLERVSLPSVAVDRLLRDADALLTGHWQVFGRDHLSFGEKPDWFLDTKSGRRIPGNQYAFDLPYRDESKFGNIKYIWEPSRHHHLTLLATAYAITGKACYAERVATHLRSWWCANPFLSGPHWISGIEIGIRLLAWVWIRRLLNRWPGVVDLFEDNSQFIDQLYHHQEWLAAFPSRGSSANNHLIAEAVGQFVAACAFPDFKESSRWRDRAASIVRREAVAQTFASGLNRELATDYHGLALELFLAAAIEGELAGYPLGASVWERIRAMTDALAAIVDTTGHPPRQGDSDDGIGLLLDSPDYNRWTSLLSTGRLLFGALPWWPGISEEDIRTKILVRGVSPPALPQNRPSTRPHLFADAGQAYLRSGIGNDEIWCRCDHGPHGFLSIAAHAHADALSVELRVGGVQVLADPGTYCYHGDPAWRAYFRSTLGHNTVELLAVDQSVSRGPFLWTDHARSRLLTAEGLEEDAPLARWQAEHCGYVTRGGPIHRRTVELDRAKRALSIRDEIQNFHSRPVPARIALHLGPDIVCRIGTGKASLSWIQGHAELDLAPEMAWSLHRGETKPPMGWFSSSFDVKVPSSTIVGFGKMLEGTPVITRMKIYSTDRYGDYQC